ncbi:MAG: hypothetical protein ACLSBC_03610 [[Clostridium] scindens]
MTTVDIESHIKDLYDIDLSDCTISRITDKVLPLSRKDKNGPWKMSMPLFLWRRSIIMYGMRDVS